MAEYENLTTLEGLQVGDTVKYATDSGIGKKIWNLETKGYKFNIVINGSMPSQYASFVDSAKDKAGKTIADVNCKNIPNLTLYYYRGSNGIAYGNFSTYDSLLNYRLLVAGAHSGGQPELKGGGVESTGRTGDGYTLIGATQTEGGKAVYSAATLTINGRFGYGGNDNDTDYTQGGPGWYGGGYAKGKYVVFNGGSGFIIGKTTTTYPSGYLGDDTALQSSLASAISNSSTITGGSDGTGTIILTILALPGAETGNSIKYYTNGAWKDATMKVYTNGVWKSASPKVYKNSTWK